MAKKVFAMTHVLLQYHIKVKKSGGAFKAIQTNPMHFHSVMLDSDFERAEGQNKVVYEQKSRLQAWLAKVYQYQELWWVLESATE